MPLRLASFHGATWDYTLYSEGFLAPFASNGGLHDTVSSFISIDELIDHPTLDPAYVSIPDFVKQKNEKTEITTGKITPFALAYTIIVAAIIGSCVSDHVEENSIKWITCNSLLQYFH